jgi:hypothetical protein
MLEVSHLPSNAGISAKFFHYPSLTEARDVTEKSLAFSHCAQMKVEGTEVGSVDRQRARLRGHRSSRIP